MSEIVNYRLLYVYLAHFICIIFYLKTTGAYKFLLLCSKHTYELRSINKNDSNLIFVAIFLFTKGVQ